MPKHHYNPNFILRRFADDSDTLWVLDKDTGRCWPKRGGRQNRYDAFAENGYNTVKDARGVDDDSVEDFYTEVEARAAPIIDTLVSTAQARLTDWNSLTRRALDRLQADQVMVPGAKLHREMELIGSESAFDVAGHGLPPAAPLATWSTKLMAW